MIDPKVVAARKSAAPKLAAIIEKGKKCTDALSSLKSAASLLEGSKQPLFDAIDSAISRLTAVTDRANKRYERFKSGLISVAVGGIEKSGKTTILKTLTGIQDLPTANERCTAVCCEIIYSTTKKEFDLEFHTDEQFALSILQPIIQRFNKALLESQATHTIGILPNSLTEFESMALPELEGFTAGTDAEIQLRELRSIQCELPIIRQYVGKSPKLGNDLSNLKEWVANHDEPSAKAKVSTVSRCIIHTAFLGGSENLRWIDTPGVDDPSPLARERTLKSVGRDADLLVVATMPRDKPSVTNSFVDFWTSISNMSDDIGLIERLLIFLNWSSVADPEKVEINKHKGYLMTSNKVPSHLFCGPLEAIKSEDVSLLMTKVNEHLAANIAAQDQKVITRIENDLKSVFADIRRDIFDKARAMHPGDPEMADSEFGYFLNWFSKATATGKEEGFIPRLRQAFHEAVNSIPKGTKVQDAQNGLEDIYKQQYDGIRKGLPTKETVKAFRETHAGEPPIAHYMQTYVQGSYSILINTLSRQVRCFGPLMQSEILDVLKKAGLGNLIPEGDSRSALDAFCKKLEENMVGGTEANPVLEALKEVSSLQESLQYVYRYEMRPALNFLNPLMWQGEKPQAVVGLASLMEFNGNKDKAQEITKYWEKRQLPGIQSPDEEHASTFSDMNKHALGGIWSVLKSGRCRFETIADDVIRDCQYRLTFGDMTVQAWRDLLAPQRAVLLGDKITSMRANSKKIATFRAAVANLGEILP